MLSALTISPSCFLANSTARADLPLAVGPVIRIASIPFPKDILMALVATLIANPSNPVLTQALAEKAAAAIDAPGLYWLADGIAADLAIRDGMSEDDAEKLLREAVSGHRVDVVV